MTLIFCCGMLNMLGRLWAVLFSVHPRAIKKRPAGRPCTKEMTLDCLFFRTSFSVKGHFCSFLLSNIIGYLAFLNLDLCLFILIFFHFLFWFKICFAWSHLLIKSTNFSCHSVLDLISDLFRLLSIVSIPDVKESFSDP